MVILQEKMRLGPKGQVVIPKIFRKAYNLAPGEEVVFVETESGILIEKQSVDIVQIAEEASRKAGIKGKVDWDKQYYEQIEERLRRAGIQP